MSNKIIYKKNNVDYTFRLLDSNSSPIDITNYTVFFTVKNNTSESDNDAIISKTIEPGNHSDPTNGETIISLSSSDTDINAGIYIYDIQTKDGNGKIKTMLLGNLTVRATATNRTS